MRVNWKFKCCGVITLVLVVSISYQIWYLGHGGYYNANSGYNYRKRPYSHSLVHTHKHTLKVDEKIFSADEVTHFILLILKNETVTDALKSVMEEHNRQYHKKGTKLTFEASANMMLKDILHGRNKNFFLDVDERHDFDVINRTCTSIEKSLSKKGRCILSLEGTLCSDRRRLPPLVKGKKQKIEKPHRWTKQVTEVCDYMYMNSVSMIDQLSIGLHPFENFFHSYRGVTFAGFRPMLGPYGLCAMRDVLIYRGPCAVLRDLRNGGIPLERLHYLWHFMRIYCGLIH